MTVAQRILAHITLGAGVVIAVTSAVTYAIVYEAAKQRETARRKGIWRMCRR